MLSIKEGVCLLGLNPIMAIAITVLNDVYRFYGCNCTITSGTDGKHMAHSLHYKGFSLDIRTAGIAQATMDEIIAKSKENLGPAFQVVLERDHLHVEFDPA